MTIDNQNPGSGPSRQFTEKAPAYTPIRPRGDPNEHRLAMAEEKEMQDSQLIHDRRRRNTQAAARMRGRQRQREHELIQRRDDLMKKVQLLESELASIRAQRQASEVGASMDYDQILEQLSNELQVANTAMHDIVDEVEKLVNIVRSIEP